MFSLAVARFNPANDTAFTTGEFLTLFKKNDSFWYQKAAEVGYPKITNDRDLGYSEGSDFKQSVWAHFPLYPLLIRYTERIFDCDFEHSCFILSCVFSLSCFIGFYFLCIRLFSSSEKDSFFYTLVFMLFPFHYYFNMYYTEALFFTSMAFSFLALYKKNYLAAAFWFIPLTLVRPNGIVTLIPLLFYFIETEGGFKPVMIRFLSLDKTLVKRSLCFLTAPLAMGVYCLYQKEMTGHYFAFVQAQYGWYKEFMFPFLAFFRQGDFPTQFNSIYVIVVILFCAFIWRKLPLSLNLLIWISILLPMASGSVACMPRYISVLFPITICLAGLLPKNNFRIVSLAVLFCLQLLTFYPWLFMDPFSY
jgi:Gpi18-like mannosyltransferase